MTTTVADLLSYRARSTTSSVIRDLLVLTEQPGMLSMAGGLPAPELLPVEAVAEAAARVLATFGPRALQYAPTEGVSELRAVVAGRLDVPVEQVLVTTGSQQGLDLAARALVDPGDDVVVEMPSYLGALQAFRAAGANLVAVSGDRDGLRVDELAERLANGLRPKIVYVVTEFQNPSGATLAGDRRVALAALADRHGFMVIDDNPYGELRFRGARSLPMRQLSDNVLTLGTASKILSPGLRVAWAVAPDWLYGSLVRAKQAADLHTSTLGQFIVADRLADTAFMAAHLAASRSLYAVRAEALATALGRLGRSIEFEPVDGGLFLWARLVEAGSTGGSLVADALLPLALDEQVAFVPGRAFRVDDRPTDTLRLCFATLAPDQLDEAVRRLERAIRRAGSTPRSAGC